MLGQKIGESSECIRERCQAARKQALSRQGKPNAMLQGKEIEQHAEIQQDAMNFLQAAATKLGWSARTMHRSLKVARTIADLAQSLTIEVAHVAESV